MVLAGKHGAGAFQWNFGGWFGSQVGSTLWLVILGVVLFSQSRTLGCALIVLGLAPNFIGLALWRRRDRLAPYPALQLLIALGGLSAALAVMLVAVLGPPPTSAGLPSPWFLLFYPALMLGFHVQERRARKFAAQQANAAELEAR